MSDAEGDTNSEITTKNLKKKVVEEAKHGRNLLMRALMRKMGTRG